MEQKKKKKLQINNLTYKKVADDLTDKFCISDKITKNSFCDNIKYKFNFQYFFVSICKNGGLIAMCKTKDYFDPKANPLRSNLIVMHQDGRTVYRIANSELFKKRYVVSLEFNNKEQLYAFCNDGEIFKIDILELQAKKLDFYSSKLDNEKILRAKAFEKGFIILTGAGTIFYLKEIKSKENKLEFMISLRDNLKIKDYENCEFFVIPSSESEEGSDEELVIYERDKEGLYLVKKIKASGSEFRAESTTQNYSDMKVNVLYINSNNVDKFNTKLKEVEHEDLENALKDENKIGPISGVAISNSNKKLAIYVAKKKTVYVMSTNIPSKGLLKFQKFNFNIEHDEYEDEEDAKEKNSILEFKNKQLLFMTDDSVAICGGRWVIMVNNKGKTIIEDLSLDREVDRSSGPYIHCKCITEVDGIRIMTHHDIILIRQLPNDIKPVYDIFAENPTKKLLSSYEKYLAKDPFSNNELREIKDKLPDAIFTLVKASGYLYWVEKEQDTGENKELQNYFLKAANYGKSIFGKLEFNFDKFNNLCMNLRIINALRNFPDKPRFVTLDEYESLVSDATDGILKKTMRQLNFKLAFEISKFLGLPERDIYLKYAIKKIKKIGIEDTKEANQVYEELMPMLRKLENISYIEIAKKCFKYNKRKLGEKFLANEKSSLVKIPQYLELKEWNKSIELAIESNDINAIMVVLDNIYKVEAESLGIKKDEVNEVFVKTLASYPNIKIPVINYLKKNNKINDINQYLIEIKDTEELFYFSVENFFKSQSKKEREEILEKLKSIKLDKSDKKFYDNYISDLESSLKFKKQCLEKEIFGKNDTTNFDNSIFDCFEEAISKSKEIDWVLKENQKNFKLANRKMTIIRFKNLFKNHKQKEIEDIIEKEGIKKLDISYVKIASMFLENGNKEKAKEYALKENKDILYEDKAMLLIKLEEYIEAGEAALKIKDRDKFEEIFNMIGQKVGNNPEKQEQLQAIYNRKK